jgi:hypothetical protein
MASFGRSHGYVANRGDDVGVSTATTDIAAQALPDFRVGQSDVLLRHIRRDVTWPTEFHFRKHADRRADLAGGAIAALESVVLDERGLKRVKSFRGAETLNGHDVIVVVHDRERQTRVYAPSICQHCTRTALSVIATLLCPDEAEMLA